MYKIYCCKYEIRLCYNGNCIKQCNCVNDTSCGVVNDLYHNCGVERKNITQQLQQEKVKEKRECV